MFTGIIQGTGRVVRTASSAEGGLELTVDVRELLDEAEPAASFPAHGASICVSGCCLTAARLDPEAGEVGFDVIAETLRCTTLGGLRDGSEVNLEASVQPTTRMDGHIVQGHIEGMGEVLSIERQGRWVARIRPPAELMPAIVPKGSIAVEGVSLTLAAVDVAHGWFEIALIPTTLDLTTLGGLKPGSMVNLETDIMARTAVHWLAHFGPGAPSR